MTSMWRTCGWVLLGSALILALSLGVRHGFGLFLSPMSAQFGWGREVFAFAIALQNLIWGLAQPFTGALADRFGAAKVVLIGGVLYALGLVCMGLADSPLSLSLSAGLLIGIGIFNYIQGDTLKRLLGVMIVVLSARELINMFAKRKNSAPLSRSKSTAYVLSAGIVHGIYATGGPLLVYALNRLNMSKSIFRSTLAAIWTALNIVLVFSYVLTEKVTALFSKGGKGGKGYKGHRKGGKGGGGTTQAVKCYRCGYLGHKRETCHVRLPNNKDRKNDRKNDTRKDRKN